MMGPNKPLKHFQRAWVDRYFELLGNSQTGQGEALALKRSKFPKALYRYRSLEHLAWRLEELRDGYLFLSNPADFNDPYDSALSASFEQFEKVALEKYGFGYDQKTESKFFESFTEAAKRDWKFEQQFSQGGFQNLLGGLFSLLYGPNRFPENKDFSGSFRNLVRVGCLTTNPNSVVMWSHYANKHTGICVEFSGSSMLSNAKFLELVHPVRYTKKLFDLIQVFSPLISEIDIEETVSASAPQINSDCWPVLAACHKSKEWKYENEWRLVVLDPGSHESPKFSLDTCDIKPRRIILGTRIGSADEAAVRELAQKISVQVVKAELPHNRFKIVF